MATKSSLRLQEVLISAISLIVFFFLDLLDFLLCFVYRFVDSVWEENPGRCYCQKEQSEERDEHPTTISETLYERRNVFRQIFGRRLLNARMNKGENCGSLSTNHRWSDCGCEYCTSWLREGDERLHVVVKEPDREPREAWGKSSTAENVIFLHGFMSSSSFWVETVFCSLSKSEKIKLRMFAVDLLGFGRSPKPANSSYTLEEHVELIERSVITPFQLKSFHLVAHSMGCTIAISLAAKFPQLVKSITLIAPPYFASSKTASHIALNRLAERKVWPPFLFGCSVMSWYEHLGRTVCLIICRNHSKWEWIIKLFTGRRDLHFSIADSTKHTHRSAWHAMHNVICGGAKLLDRYLEVLKRAQIPMKIIQGDKDRMVPLECGYNAKSKVPHAELEIVPGADHTSVIIGREEAFTRDLECVFFSARKS